MGRSLLVSLMLMYLAMVNSMPLKGDGNSGAHQHNMDGVQRLAMQVATTLGPVPPPNPFALPFALPDNIEQEPLVSMVAQVGMDAAAGPNNHSVEQSKILHAALSLVCRSGMFHVALRKNALYTLGNLNRNQISWRDRSDSSCFVLNMMNAGENQTHFNLYTMFGHCGTERYHVTPPPRVVYRNEIIVTPSQGSNHTITVRCEAPLANAPDSNSFAQLFLPGPSSKPVNEGPDNAYNTTGTDSTLAFQITMIDSSQVIVRKYPHTVGYNHWLTISLSLHNHDNQDLRPSPRECFLSRNSNPQLDTQSHYMLLNAGCPQQSNVQLLGISRGASQFRFAALLTRPIDHYVFLHCVVVACSMNDVRYHEGYPQCPSSDQCSTRDHSNIDAISSPLDDDMALTRVVVSTGPIRFAELPTPAPLTCPPCPANMKDSYETAQPRLEKVFIVQGLTTGPVVGVAVVSFAIGFALMGGLWFIHHCTKPKGLAHKRNCSRDSASSVDSSLPNTATTPLYVTSQDSTLYSLEDSNGAIT